MMLSASLVVLVLTALVASAKYVDFELDAGAKADVSDLETMTQNALILNTTLNGKDALPSLSIIVEL